MSSIARSLDLCCATTHELSLVTPYRARRHRERRWVAAGLIPAQSRTVRRCASVMGFVSLQTDDAPS